MAEDLWSLYAWMHLVGRCLFALPFLASGLNHFRKLDTMAGYAASRGVPAPKAATAVTGVMILTGGLSVVLGWHRFIGAGLLVIFLLLAAFMMHAFWKQSDPAARAAELTNFIRNLAYAGGALFVAYYAGLDWPLSIGG